MISELDKNKQKKEKIENGIRLCEDALAKSEKYERLKDNKDWQGYLDDLKVLVTLHDREIMVGAAMVVDAPNSGYVKKDDFGKDTYVNSKRDWLDFISRHEIQKTEAQNWAKEPEKILSLATLAREKLPMLKKSLSEILEVPAEADVKS